MNPNQPVMRRPLLQPQQPGEHVWTVGQLHRISAESLRAGHITIAGLRNGDITLLPADLAASGIGCWVCDEVYSDELSDTECKGKPS